MPRFNVVVESNESTVVSDYRSFIPQDTSYQSEADLENEFIERLKNQWYEYLEIHTEKDLITNLRNQIEKLNNYKFTEWEWDTFFKWYISNWSDWIEEKTYKVQEDYIYNLKCDDWSNRNIYILDKSNIHNNFLQVINQYEVEDWKRPNRYDCTILVNWLPLIHVELKRRGVNIKEAFNQINRYQRESFWAGAWLFEFIQIFVISNWTYTKYYSNTTRQWHLDELAKTKAKRIKTSNSFEFTSRWADANNKTITDLIDFTATFFAKHTILRILINYCVFTSEKKLLVMRPYQIVACERIINKILIATNTKQLWTINAWWYIWHTTWSWKTLTSFKTAQLATNMEDVDKVLFVVDRKDLDYQTMKEYDRFQEWAANSNTSTAVLAKQLKDPNAKIIITTIQKLDKFIKKNKWHEIFDGHIVIIFDECHRSQFWEMHKSITKAFNKYHLFWFTGTPIFAKNAGTWKDIFLQTTEQAFWTCLHQYTIVDAIKDKNVLPFKVDYVQTLKEAEDIEDTKVTAIDREAILMDDQRISNITKYILDHFVQKTKRNDKSYDFSRLMNVEESVTAKDRSKVEEIKEKIRLTWFNAIFAVQSIPMAMKYYEEFKKQMSELPEAKRLKIWLIYSFWVNWEDQNWMDDENCEDTSNLDKPSRDFLESAIKNYNKYFKTSYDTSSDKFQSYYKDVSQRMKNRELDLLIVVNMFLTGFDATTLNTLWVDKNLRLHWLLQAYSRTNRILNSIKTFWNIVCFRNLEKATNESLALFWDKEAGWVVLIKTFDEYMKWYKKEDWKEVKWYVQLVSELKEKFVIWEEIISEEKKKEFINLYSKILRLRNILMSFDEFTPEIDPLAEREVQNYHSMYINLHEEFRSRNKWEEENVNDDIVFEMELIKQVEVNIDYILALISKYQKSNKSDKEILIDINRAIGSSPELRKKKDLIEAFIETMNEWDDVNEFWEKFVEWRRKEELETIISEEKLDHDKTVEYMRDAFRSWKISQTWTAYAELLPKVSMFNKNSNHKTIWNRVYEKLSLFFDKFFDLSKKEL